MAKCSSIRASILWLMKACGNLQAADSLHPQFMAAQGIIWVVHFDLPEHGYFT